LYQSVINGSCHIRGKKKTTCRHVASHHGFQPWLVNRDSTGFKNGEERPGGAANVARGVAALGAQCELLSVTGEDEAALHLQRLLEQEGVVAHLHRDATIATTIKLRVIGRQQQLLRIDFEAPPRQEVLLDKL
jgi:bifunctional ADP-heptose synthase (sugar kinase/adenylyltransferase)